MGLNGFAALTSLLLRLWQASRAPQYRITSADISAQCVAADTRPRVKFWPQWPAVSRADRSALALASSVMRTPVKLIQPPGM